MPSKRYFISIIPVQHINGKMSRVCDRVHDTTTPDIDSGVSFYYGYRRQSHPSVSRYGLREKGRNLLTHPYTSNESSNRSQFTNTLTAVNAHRLIVEDWNLMLQDYRQQHKYSTPNGYAVAMVRANGGQWLSKWVADE